MRETEKIELCQSEYLSQRLKPVYEQKIVPVSPLKKKYLLLRFKVLAFLTSRLLKKYYSTMNHLQSAGLLTSYLKAELSASTKKAESYRDGSYPKAPLK